MFGRRWRSSAMLSFTLGIKVWDTNTSKGFLEWLLDSFDMAGLDTVTLTDCIGIFAGVSKGEGPQAVMQSPGEMWIHMSLTYSHAHIKITPLAP